jgi:hypothetical protein
MKTVDDLIADLPQDEAGNVLLTREYLQALHATLVALTLVTDGKDLLALAPTLERLFPPSSDARFISRDLAEALLATPVAFRRFSPSDVTVN